MTPLLGVAALLATTAGWENVCPGRAEFPAAEIVWTAPADGLSVIREDGAEGEVSFDGGALKIRKTNGLGRIVVSAPPFAAEKGKAMRFFADVSARTDSPDAAVGFLCAYGVKRVLAFPDPISAKEFSAGARRVVGLSWTDVPCRRLSTRCPAATAHSIRASLCSGMG